MSEQTYIINRYAAAPANADMVRYRILAALLDGLCERKKIDKYTKENAVELLAVNHGLDTASIFK